MIQPMATLDQVVARSVLRLRLRAGVTQTELARRLRGEGIRPFSQSSVASVEAGDEDVDLPDGRTVPLEAIRQALGGTRVGAPPAEVRFDYDAQYENDRGSDDVELARLARRAGVPPEQMAAVSRAVFGKPWFLRLRDERAGITADMPARSAQAKRGHATRAMLEEIRAVVAEEGLAAIESGS